MRRMFKQLLDNLMPNFKNTDEIVEIRQRLQSLFFKLRTHQRTFLDDPKLNFKVFDDLHDPRAHTGYITFYLGNYVVRYEMDDTKSIQLFKRGKVDSLQFAELLAISFDSHLEYIADPLFVKADFYQLEILVNHVIKSKQQKSLLNKP
jgi:hypothetical protein